MKEYSGFIQRLLYRTRSVRHYLVKGAIQMHSNSGIHSSIQAIIMYEHSKRHNAPVVIYSGDVGDIGDSKGGGTSYYVCTACDNSYDVHYALNQ
jgi:predicted TIM-barrel fold metal-dependent hydrolase